MARRKTHKGEAAGAAPGLLPASCTVAHAAAVQSVIAKALEGERSPVIALSEVVEADLSLVQLLLAADRAARASNRTLQLVGAPPPTVQDLVRALGQPGAGPHHATDLALWEQLSR